MPLPSLRQAADYCKKLTQKSQSNFYFAFLFLPKERRDALFSVYAFCRLVDDAADDAPTPEAAKDALLGWRKELDSIYGDDAPTHPVAARLKEALTRYPIRRQDMEAVIEGCEWDATRTRYETFRDLHQYCYRVASAVGLMCIEIFGYTTPRARDYAIDLGIALQLTNILRDVDEDAARGRIYLPLEDVKAFGVSESDLIEGRRTPAVLRLLAFEAQRARGYYLRARAAISDSERARLVVAEIMGDIYYALLERLERDKFPTTRAALPTSRKATIALDTWARAKVRLLLE